MYLFHFFLALTQHPQLRWKIILSLKILHDDVQFWAVIFVENLFISVKDKWNNTTVLKYLPKRFGDVNHHKDYFLELIILCSLKESVLGFLLLCEWSILGRFWCQFYFCRPKAWSDLFSVLKFYKFLSLAADWPTTLS